MAALWATTIALAMIAVGLLQTSADVSQQATIALSATPAEPREETVIERYRYAMPSIRRRCTTFKEVMRVGGLDMQLKKRIQPLIAALNKLVPRGLKVRFCKRSDLRRNKRKRFTRWLPKSRIFRSHLG